MPLTESTHAFLERMDKVKGNRLAAETARQILDEVAALPHVSVPDACVTKENHRQDVDATSEPSQRLFWINDEGTLTFDLYDENDHRRRPLFDNPVFADEAAQAALIVLLARGPTGESDTGAKRAGKGTRVTIANLAELHPVKLERLVEAVGRLAKMVCRVSGR